MDDCTDCAPIPVVSVNTPFIFFLQQHKVKLFPIQLIFISEQMLSQIKVWDTPVFGNSEFESPISLNINIVVQQMRAKYEHIRSIIRAPTF